MIALDTMSHKPQEKDVSGLKEDDYDSIFFTQEDGWDELCDLNIPPEEVNDADISLSVEEDYHVSLQLVTLERLWQIVQNLAIIIIK